NDNLIVKIYSKIVAWFLKSFLNSPYIDINCGYKAFKREVLKEFSFYGNNFRFFPLAVFYNGFKVTEINVKNNKRKFGESKFGPNKLFTGLLDTLTAYFLFKFAEKPLHFFGVIGGVTFFIGFLISFYLTIERLFFGVLLVTRPLLWLGILLIIVGIQVIMTGIIGELVVYLNKKK
ncbi:MAG: glycosyltransferase, partial [Patescibacteria group bacterium]